MKSKGFKMKTLGELIKKDISSESSVEEHGDRRGYRHGYNQGIDDAMLKKISWRRLCSFFDKKIMPWSYFKGKYKKDRMYLPPEIY